ncbi:MAG: hypothetical protein ACI8O8_000342 [Oleiphilaceae bacterium]|jgi:hypothetical protein
MFNKLLHVLLLLSVVSVSVYVAADVTAPYSKPFHKQGRGWYPSLYWSTSRNLGSYYFPNTDGELFKELNDAERKSAEYALVYFYRPDSQWASEELEAPSYYINDTIVFNMRAGSYTYVLLPAGTYDFNVRKSMLPLLGFEAFDDKLMMAFDLNLQADFGLSLKAGDVYYVRHSEVSLPSKLHSGLEPDDEMATADVQLVERDMAMEEIHKTRYLTQSFWHPSDAANAEELLSGEMQEYGWFSVIWPWSNNFLWGFPIFYLPSDIYRELRGTADMTLEQQLYLLADDVDVYLQKIEDLREVRHNWWAPWRKSTRQLTLNDELVLERLEKAARAGKIIPASVEEEPWRPFFADGASEWYNYFEEEEEGPAVAGSDQSSPMTPERRNNVALIKQSLN